MKSVLRITLIIFLVSAACAQQPQAPLPPAVAPAAATNTAPASPAVGMFYDALAPYGNWFWLEPYGWVWTPNGMLSTWRPYTDGHWVYADCGWTWVSDWEWGWAPFHYGRWAYHAEHGWVWVPDTVWGPAWVAWNFGDPWCGWAPLPPLVAWETGPAWDFIIPPFCWSFVEVGFFTAPHIHQHIVPAARNVTLLHETKNITKFVRNDRQIVNVGIDPARVERAIGHPVPRLQVENFTTPTGKMGTVVQRDKLRVFRPDLGPAPRPVVPPSSTAQQLSVSRDFLQRQDMERRRLAEDQAREAAQLQEIHRRELANPPQGLNVPSLAQRHFEEHRALNEQIARQNQLFEHRAQQGISQPPANTGAPHAQRR
jgi:hypothetical protein